MSSVSVFSSFNSALIYEQRTVYEKKLQPQKVCFVIVTPRFSQNWIQDLDNRFADLELRAHAKEESQECKK